MAGFGAGANLEHASRSARYTPTAEISSRAFERGAGIVAVAPSGTVTLLFTASWRRRNYASSSPSTAARSWAAHKSYKRCQLEITDEYGSDVWGEGLYETVYRFIEKVSGAS